MPAARPTPSPSRIHTFGQRFTSCGTIFTRRFGLERVLEHLDVSRRLLHERFQRLLGRPPYEYLCGLRVERAKQLLSIPNRVKMQKIATECGFSSAARMRLVFQRIAGMTPLEYHRLHGIVAASKSPKNK